MEEQPKQLKNWQVGILVSILIIGAGLVGYICYLDVPLYIPIVIGGVFVAAFDYLNDKFCDKL